MVYISKFLQGINKQQLNISALQNNYLFTEFRAKLKGEVGGIRLHTPVFPRVKVAQDPCSLIYSLAKFLVGVLSCKALIQYILNIDCSKI